MTNLSSQNLASLKLILALALFIQISYAADPLPQAVITQLASRQMRYHHYLWHQMRANWNSFSESTKNEFRKINWAPPNPSRDSQGRTITSNYAGEDFLYMHRNMISKVNQIAAQSGSSYRVKGWTTIPAPGDREYPVPPPYRQGSESESLKSYKVDSYYYNTMVPAERTFKNPSNLRKWSLNELGRRLEAAIHFGMHMRWTSASSVGYRTGGTVRTAFPNIDKKWDNPNYIWMVDPYASHVDPIFWKLHGWIDDRIEDWRKANGLSSIRWRGTWTGGPMSSVSVARKEGLEGADSKEKDPEAVDDVLQKVMDLFVDSGVKEFTFAEPLIEAPQKRKNRKNCKARYSKKGR